MINLKKKIKIVHYLPNLVNGGIESMLLNYYSKLSTEFTFVVVIHNIPEEKCLKAFNDLGITVYQITHWNNNFIKHFKELYNILIIEKPEIFQTHHNLYNFIPCFIAKCAGVKKRISHCHNYLPKKNIKQKLFSFLSYVFSTNQAACGIGAATFLTNKSCVSKNKVKIIYNAIPIDKYKYNPNIRNKIRNLHQWNDFYVYGNVGRFCEQKNQLFLIKIYEQIYANNPNSRFLIIGGDGPLYKAIKDKIDNSSIRNVTTILKNITNVNEYYQAMDFLLLPSLYEGVSVTLIEGLISNLPCIISDTITDEFTSKLIHYASIKSVDSWISEIQNIRNNSNRINYIDKELLEKFDIEKLSKNLSEYYKNLLR